MYLLLTNKMKFMRKLYLMSIMLMGIMSLLTSCVDGDYYEIYENEDESFMVRNKKGKEVVDLYNYDNYDYSNYPMMEEGGEYNGWHVAECVACCLSNFYPGKSGAWYRRKVIEAQYGCFNMNSYGAYFYSVTRSSGGNLPSGSALTKAFNYAYVIDDHVREKASDIVDKALQGQSISYDKVAVIDAAKRHIAMVDYIHVYQMSGGGYRLTIDVFDQHGFNGAKYTIELNSNRNLTRSDISAFFL